MIRKLLAAGVLLIAGYIAGAFFGYRAAVADYVENDAENIESVADDMYPSPSEGDKRSVPDEVAKLIERAEQEQDSDEDTTADDGSCAFQ